MLPRRHARLALAALFVCGHVHPVLADGARVRSRAPGETAVGVVALLAVGIIALFARALSKRNKPKVDKRPEQLPVARVMNERSRSEPKQ